MRPKRSLRKTQRGEEKHHSRKLASGLGNSPGCHSPACPAISPPPDAALLATGEAGGAERCSICCSAPQDTSLRPSGEPGAHRCPHTHLGSGGGRLQVFTGADGSSRSHAVSWSARKQQRDGRVRPAARAETAAPRCAQPKALMPKGLSRCLHASPKMSHLAHMPSAWGGVYKGAREILPSHHLLPALSFDLCLPPKGNANYGGQLAAALTHLPASQHSLDLKPRPPPRLTEIIAALQSPPHFKAEAGTPGEPTASQFPAHTISLPLVFLTLGIKKDKVLVQNPVFEGWKNIVSIISVCCQR